jgi:urease accessory protein
LGLPVPAIEPGIALSVVGLGSVIAADARPPLAVAGISAGGFAIFHGYAHGAELPEAAAALPYCLGFVLATGLIHLGGIGIGHAIKLPRGLLFLRSLGAAIAVVGVYFALGLFSN